MIDDQTSQAALPRSDSKHSIQTGAIRSSWRSSAPQHDPFSSHHPHHRHHYPALAAGLPAIEGDTRPRPPLVGGPPPPGEPSVTAPLVPVGWTRVPWVSTHADDHTVAPSVSHVDPHGHVDHRVMYDAVEMQHLMGVGAVGPPVTSAPPMHPHPSAHHPHVLPLVGATAYHTVITEDPGAPHVEPPAAVPPLPEEGDELDNQDDWFSHQQKKRSRFLRGYERMDDSERIAVAKYFRENPALMDKSGRPNFLWSAQQALQHMLPDNSEERGRMIGRARKKLMRLFKRHGGGLKGDVLEDMESGELAPHDKESEMGVEMGPAHVQGVSPPQPQPPQPQPQPQSQSQQNQQLNHHQQQQQQQQQQSKQQQQHQQQQQQHSSTDIVVPPLLVEGEPIPETSDGTPPPSSQTLRMKRQRQTTPTPRLTDVDKEQLKQALYNAYTQVGPDVKINFSFVAEQVIPSDDRKARDCARKYVTKCARDIRSKAEKDKGVRSTAVEQAEDPQISPPDSVDDMGSEWVGVSMGYPRS